MAVNRPDQRKRCHEKSYCGLATQPYDIMGSFSSIGYQCAGRRLIMNNSLWRLPRLTEPGPGLQLLVSMTLVFLLAFGADVLLQRAVGLFVAGIVEQDTFFSVGAKNAWGNTVID